LIDTRSDTHVWAEHYDRDLERTVCYQNEIAQTVAERLNARLSASEKASIEEDQLRTWSPYDFYVRAISMIYKRPGALYVERMRRKTVLRPTRILHGNLQRKQSS